jgi:hypothetical protein
MERINEIIPAVLAGFQQQGQSAKSRIWNQWASVMGPKFAARTRPSLGQNGRLFIWVDEAVLAFELNQKHKSVILKRAQSVVEEIKEIIFRVGQLR